MMRRLLSIGLLVSLLAGGIPIPVQAASTGLDACRKVVEQGMRREHEIFRAVLFGRTEAEEAPITTVRHDQKGNAWIKLAEDEWHSAAEGFERTTWGDAQMDEEMEKDAIQDIRFRPGIFETRRVSTSEIVPHITQALRALQCRTLSVAELARESQSVDGDQPKKLTVQIPGCVPMEYLSFPACHLVTNSDTKMTESDVFTYGDTLALQVVEKEREVAKFAVEYDAAYRTLLQLAGNTDLFLDALKTALTGTLFHATELIQLFNRIPCFLGACDESPRKSGSSTSP